MITEVSKEREKCEICSEFVDYCECRRCEECEELTHVNLAKKRCKCGGSWF